MKTNPRLSAWTAGGKVMRISSLVDYGIFTFAMQPIGEPITSGKVRVSVDGRTPDKWYWNNRYLSFQVGSTALYGASHNGYVAQVIAQSQFTSDSDSGTPYLTMKSNGTNGKVGVNGKFSTWYRIVTTIDMDERTYGVKVYELGATSRAASFAVDATHWYRFVAKADANARTYDLKVYDMGATQPEASTPNGTAVVAMKGLAFAAGADADISGSALLVAGTSGNADTRFAYFDNVSVTTKSRGMLILFR